MLFIFQFEGKLFFRCFTFKRKLLNVTLIFFCLISCTADFSMKLFNRLHKNFYWKWKQKGNVKSGCVEWISSWIIASICRWAANVFQIFSYSFAIKISTFWVKVSQKYALNYLKLIFTQNFNNFWLSQSKNPARKYSGGNAIENAVITIWNYFNQMPYNVDMAPASLQTLSLNFE